MTAVRAAVALGIALAVRDAAADPATTTTVPLAPTLSAPTDHIKLEPIVITREPEEPIDKRPFVIGGGAMVLVALLLWNRARDKKLEAEHGPTSPRQRRWRVKPDEGAEGADEDAASDAEELADAADGDDHPEEKP